MDTSKLKSLTERNFSQHQIAKELGSSQTNVRYWLKKLGLRTSAPFGRRSNKASNANWIIIQSDYDAGLSWDDLCEKHNLAPYMLAKASRSGLFRSRGKSEACLLAHSSGKHDYLSHRTPEYRKKMSKTGGLKARSGRCKIIKFKNSLGYEYCLQGTWELRLAEFLNSRRINWVKNTQSFLYELENKTRKYYPDFYLPDLNVFVEVKGYETDKDRAKWAAFPEKLVVCRKKDIDNLSKFWQDNFNEFQL